MLADLPLLPTYRSDEHDLLQEFYIPCLSNSTHYRRAGLFSSLCKCCRQRTSCVHKGGGRMEAELHRPYCLWRMHERSRMGITGDSSKRKHSKTLC